MQTVSRVIHLVSELIISKERPTQNTYKKWLHDVNDVRITNHTEKHYDDIVTRAMLSFQQSPLWKYFNEKLQDYDDEYLSKYDDNLRSSIPFFLETKKFDSFLLKTFRMNVQDNENWPNMPEKYGDWIVESNWFDHIHDPIRTLVVVKYLDGVKFMVEKLSKACDKFDVKCRYDYESNEDGYYAAHFYIGRYA